jgi:hypothetical protein
MSADADLDSVPKPITPGPEMAALARFHTDVTWTGTIQPGGMGPGTPAMTAVGWGKHETIQDGMVWKNEMSVGGAPWSLVEEYHCRPA